MASLLARLLTTSELCSSNDTLFEAEVERNSVEAPPRGDGVAEFTVQVVLVQPEPPGDPRISEKVSNLGHCPTGQHTESNNWPR